MINRIAILAALLMLFVTMLFTVLTWSDNAGQIDQGKKVEECSVTYDTTNLDYSSAAYKTTQTKYNACVAAAYGVAYAPAN